MPVSESQKRANTKWRENNKEYFNELCRNNMKTYYEKNREEKIAKALERYYRKKLEKIENEKAENSISDSVN